LQDSLGGPWNTSPVGLLRITCRSLVENATVPTHQFRIREIDSERILLDMIC